MTKILNWPMNSGKTTELVKMMLQPGNEDVVYVAPTMQQAENVAWRLALSLGAENTGRLRNRFISVSEVSKFQGHYPRVRFVVDEVDYVISYLLRGDVLAVAGTDEAEKAAYAADPSGYYVRKEEV